MYKKIDLVKFNSLSHFLSSMFINEVTLKPKFHQLPPLIKAVRTFYPNLKDKLSTDDDFKKALNVGRRYFFDHYEKDCLSEPPAKKSRVAGGGRKGKCPEFRFELFQLFIDLR